MFALAENQRDVDGPWRRNRNVKVTGFVTCGLSRMHNFVVFIDYTAVSWNTNVPTRSADLFAHA